MRRPNWTKMAVTMTTSVRVDESHERSSTSTETIKVKFMVW